ncbi:MAG: hypothetical protein WC299_08665 [Kiritimatiellia bacterium]
MRSNVVIPAQAGIQIIGIDSAMSLDSLADALAGPVPSEKAGPGMTIASRDHGLL